jgi:tetratricopeptide (TPR) repeat protein
LHVKEFVHNGRKLLATRKFQEAVKVCRIGLLEDPASVEGRLVLAQALMSLARYDEVIAEARAALELKEESAPATVLLGEALFFKGAYVQARETLQRAAVLDPDNATVSRLLDELDATVEVGIAETSDDVGDSTRSYPEATGDPTVGDETEIQELPAALQHAEGEHAPAEPLSEEATRGAVEAAHKAAEDQERPDPVAGEVKIGTGEVVAGAHGPTAPIIKVDISQYVWRDQFRRGCDRNTDRIGWHQYHGVARFLTRKGDIKGGRAGI